MISLTNPCPNLFRGYRYQARWFNGAELEFWSSVCLSRKEARFHARAMMGPEIYGTKELESVRLYKGAK